MATLQNFAQLPILTSKIDPKISDRYLKDWLFYRPFCKIQNGL